MRFDSEEELEDLIVKHHQKTGECPITKGEIGKLYRQFSLPGYGVMDLLALSAYGDPAGVFCEITIYELKLGQLNDSHVSQIARYYRGFREYLENIYSLENGDHGLEITFEGSHIPAEITLNGLLITAENKGKISDSCYTIDSIDWLSWHTYSLDIAEGIVFEEHSGWFNHGRTEERFPDEKIELDALLKGALEEYIVAYNHVCGKPEEEVSHGKTN